MTYNYKNTDEKLKLEEVESLINNLIRYSQDIVIEEEEEDYYKAIEILNMAEQITCDYSDLEELPQDKLPFYDVMNDISDYKMKYVERLEEIHSNFLWSFAKLN